MVDISDKLRGIIVPLLTPLSGDGRVDEISLRNLANYVVDGGVNGIFVMGTTGEFQYLPFDEQRAAIEAVADEVGRRCLVVAGVTGNSMEETIRNATVIGSLHTPPHALVVAPLCYHSNRNLPQHMQRFAGLSGLPILLYNNIGIVARRWKRKDIIPELAGRMALLDNIVGIKDSSGNLEYLSRILRYQSPAFRIFQGEETLILPALKKGADGAVPSMGNILPRLCAKLYNAYLESDMKSAQAYQDEMKRIDALYPNPSSIAPILKAYLARKGIIANAMSFIPFKGDVEPIMARFESAIQELKQKRNLKKFTNV
jgi:4-hydroxy-tetrahydrodipicolinate synthase